MNQISWKDGSYTEVIGSRDALIRPDAPLINWGLLFHGWKEGSPVSSPPRVPEHLPCWVRGHGRAVNHRLWQDNQTDDRHIEQGSPYRSSLNASSVYGVGHQRCNCSRPGDEYHRASGASY